MITLRPSKQRGHANHGWLDSYHTFSFANYYDPAQMGFRSLRVINEDRVRGGRGFGTHPHRDMEILTYVLEGSLEHKDSMGNGSVIGAHEVQRLSAGTGITHSEFNHSQSDWVHLLQIWILPQVSGIEPSYDQRLFKPEEKRGQLRLIASRDGRDGAIPIHQDVDLFATVLAQGETVSHTPKPNRHAWVQVAQGAVTLNGAQLNAGDGAAVSDEANLQIGAQADSEVLLFDLA